MQMFVEGPRFTSQTLMQAQAAAPELLPVLTDQQKRIAQDLRLSEDAYARDVYAGLLAEPEWTSVIERLGFLLRSLLDKYLPAASIRSITWQTSREMFRVAADHGGRLVEFSIREGVVNDLFSGGDKEALDRLGRIVEMASLPYVAQQRVS